jgi:hypothetical protein
MHEMIVADDLVEFLPLSAYELLDRATKKRAPESLPAAS